MKWKRDRSLTGLKGVRKAEEMAQSVKYLPCKHEGLILDLQHQHENTGTLSCANNPSTGEGEKGGFMELSSQLL